MDIRRYVANNTEWIDGEAYLRVNHLRSWFHEQFGGMDVVAACEAKANADLLAACEAYVAWLDGVGDSSAGNVARMHAAFRSAIAKAKGETP